MGYQSLEERPEEPEEGSEECTGSGGNSTSGAAQFSTKGLREHLLKSFHNLNGDAASRSDEGTR